MSMTTQSKYVVPFKEFDVETEMTDVEILHVTPDRILAKGKRFGRQWLLRGVPPGKRNDPDSLRQFIEEFDRRYDRQEPNAPLTVGLEDIEGLGPCIVEEWREDYAASEDGGANPPKHGLALRRGIVIIAVLMVLSGALGAGFHIRRLTERSEAAKADLEALRLANRQGEARMFMLADSLDKVISLDQIPEDFGNILEIAEEDEEEKIANALYQARTKEFDLELVRYDRQVIPEVIDDRPVFLDSICVLYHRMLDWAADVDPHGIFPQLPEDDRIRLTASLYGGYMLSFCNYSRVWMPKAWKTYKKKKMERDSGKEEAKK